MKHVIKEIVEVKEKKMLNWSQGMTQDYQEGLAQGKRLAQKGGFYIMLAPIFGQTEAQFKAFPACYLQGLSHGLRAHII